jgi:uncharacterized protein
LKSLKKPQNKNKMISLKDGEKLVKLARESILSKFKGKTPDFSDYSKYNTMQGVFVTLHKHGALRGCVGFPMPYYPLNEAIKKAAIAAAFEDTRFQPLAEYEYKDIQFEISILTVPQKIIVRNPDDYIKKIRIGEDGLIIKNRFTSGLLLPQVAHECGFDSKEFLEQTCEKAGLTKSAWKEIGTEVYKFQAEIFSEENGRVVLRKE